MSFGFAVGDFFAVGQLALKVYNQCRGCSGHYRDLSRDAGQLALTLSHLEDIRKKRRLDAAQKAKLLEHGQACKEVLLAIQGVLREYENLSTKSKRIRDMLGWNYEGARELRDRLTATIVMLSSFYDTLTLSAVFRLEDAMKQLLRETHTGQKSADSISILTTESIESVKTPQAWRQIVQDLEDLGISSEDATKNRIFIVQWFTQALEEAQRQSGTPTGEESGFPTSKPPTQLLVGHDASAQDAEPKSSTKLPFMRRHPVPTMSQTQISNVPQSPDPDPIPEGLGRDRAVLAREVQTRLIAKMQNNRDKARAFISRQDVERVWFGNENHFKALLDSLKISNDEKTLEKWRTSKLLVLSILIWIGWPDWESDQLVRLMKTLGGSVWSDDILPTNHAFLQTCQSPRLGTETCVDFIKAQYLFIPPVLEVNSAVSAIPRFDQKLHLPFVMWPDPVQAFGRGRQTAIVAARHLRLVDRSISNEDTKVTCVCIQPTLYAYPSLYAHFCEVLYLVSKRLLLATDAQNNLLYNLAVFFQDEICYTISTFAESNLEELLSMTPNIPADVLRASPAHLLVRMTDIARALQFLHANDNKGSIQKWSISHNDIAPYNIAIEFSSNGAYHAGTWKLTGFEFATIYQPIGIPRPSDAPVGLIVHNSPRQGRYVAPECSDGRRFNGKQADVWSFGRILEDVVRFASCEWYWTRRFDFGSSHSTRLKVRVLEVLNAATKEESESWTQPYRDLTVAICKEIPTTRPSAQQIRQSLVDCQQGRHSVNFWKSLRALLPYVATERVELEVAGPAWLFNSIIFNALTYYDKMRTMPHETYTWKVYAIWDGGI